MDANAVASDEARRIAQHEAVKAKLEKDVHSRITEESAASTPTEQAAVKSVAAGLKQKATSEVAETEGALNRARSSTRISQVVDYAFYLIYGLIGLEIALGAVWSATGQRLQTFPRRRDLAVARSFPRPDARPRGGIHAVDALLRRGPRGLRAGAHGGERAPPALRGAQIQDLTLSRPGRSREGKDRGRAMCGIQQTGSERRPKVQAGRFPVVLPGSIQPEIGTI